jgi:hypothetical protein
VAEHAQECETNACTAVYVRDRELEEICTLLQLREGDAINQGPPCVFFLSWKHWHYIRELLPLASLHWSICTSKWTVEWPRPTSSIHHLPRLLFVEGYYNVIGPCHPTSLRCILILSSHLWLGLSRDLFPSIFPTEIIYAFYFSPIRATCPAHLTLLDLIILILLFEEYMFWRFSLRRRKISWYLK